MKHTLLALLACSVLITACSDDGDDDSSLSPEPGTDNLQTGSTPAPDNRPIETGDPGITMAESARYRLTFNALWSVETHPVDFPGASAHFSGLIGAVHNEQVIFWEPGQIASDGIEFMAETGGKSLFQSEIDTAVDAGSALSVISGGGVGISPGDVTVEFTVTRDYPEFTLVSMIAPSPDWFVGVHNQSLLENGDFVDSLTVDLLAYDSGTDGGLQYTSGDVDTQPREPIARVTSEPANTSFVDGLPIVGTFVLERLESDGMR